MSEYKFSDYGIFSEGIQTANKLNESLGIGKDTIAECKTTLGNSAVFMGPAADSCVEGLSSVSAVVDTLVSNFSTIGSYLSTSATNYKGADQNAIKEMLSIDSTGRVQVGTGGAAVVTNEADLPSIKVSDVQNCQSVQEYLDLVMPVYSYYCQKYGIKYPGVLALQPVHEHSAPTGIQAQSAVEDNNLGGLKYAEGIPNATPGSTPSDGTGGIYSHFDDVTQYVEAACWNIAHDGSYYQDAMAQDNMSDFTTSLVDTWVGHPDNYGSSIVDEYSQYGLEKYELK